MIQRIEIVTRPGQSDPLGQAALSRIRHFSDHKLKDIRSVAVFSYDDAALGSAADLTAARLGADLFQDPVLNQVYENGAALEQGAWDWYVEVAFRPGVTDNVGRTATESVAWRLGRPLAPGHQLHSAIGYFITGALTQQQAQQLAATFLANELIQQITVLPHGATPQQQEVLFRLPVVELTQPIRVLPVPLGDDQALMQLSRERLLALTLEEMAAIRAYYAEPQVQAARRQAGLGPEPTDVELEVLAQTWSEHCKHKIFNATIAYDDGTGQVTEIRSLYKTYIQGTTKKVRQAWGQEDWCLSVFTDNAGVVRFTDDWSLVFKVETHNSPSALDPYGGALTGIVGVNRDPFGTGRGAELLFNTDVFCFASPFYDQPLPPGLLHPRRIYEGVRHGVEHGGNKMGVPTVNGSVNFHPGFLGKPLVFCGTGGLLPAHIGARPGHQKWVNPGDLIVMVGGRIGADGIHGATFSSLELNEHSPVTAVQIGDPIVQKRMFDFLLAARDLGLYNAITDNGAGGLSSSVGEMAEMSGGATLHLDQAPLKYPGLQPWEILVSESQERMTLAVPPDKFPALQALAQRMDVEIANLGQFNDSGVIQALYGNKVVALLDMDFLHNGVPVLQMKARFEPPHRGDTPPPPPHTSELGGILLELLGRLNICSKETLIRQYDHEVQGGSVVKPLSGANADGPSDAAVLRPLLGQNRGLVISHGICPRYAEIDAYAMAANAVDEAVRAIIASGGSLKGISGLDNFCWCDPLPSPTNPDAHHKAAQLVRAAQALHDVCVAYGIPLISGKDSMKNDYVRDGLRISIPPTLLFSAVGVLKDVRRAVTMDVKATGDPVYLVGHTKAELGASEYLARLGLVDSTVPQVDTTLARKLYLALEQATHNGWLRSAHDCSDGGLAVALAETAFAGDLGLELELESLAHLEGLAPHELLFAESASRLVVSVSPHHSQAFEQHMAGLPCHRLGQVTQHQRLILRDHQGQSWIDLPLTQLKAAWQDTLSEF